MTLLEPMWLPTKTVPFGPASGKQGLRYMLQQHGLQEGVYDAGDFDVTQRGAGANMSVDVAAGGAWVQGDDTARQGFYHLVNDATVNVAVSAAHATLPRVDQVVARVYDSSVAGGSDTPAVEVIAGTATSGAQCTDPAAANYRTGAAALPNGCVRLADVQVDAAVASIVNAKIYDRRPWARGFRSFTRYTAGSDYTNATTSLTAAGPSTKCELSGGPCRVRAQGRMNSPAGILQLVIFRNGAQQNIPFRLPASQDIEFSAQFEFAFAAGASVIDLRAALVSASGTGTIYRSGGYAIEWSIEEPVRQNQENT